MRRDQGWRCAYCGGPCRGHGHGEPRLEVHHNLPDAAGGSNARTNAVGLCGRHPDGGCGCHESFDQLYFRVGKTFVDVMLAEGREYDLRRLGLHPAQTPQERPRRAKTPPLTPYNPQPETGRLVGLHDAVYYDESPPKERQTARRTS